MYVYPGSVYSFFDHLGSFFIKAELFLLNSMYVCLSLDLLAALAGRPDGREEMGVVWIVGSGASGGRLMYYQADMAADNDRDYDYYYEYVLLLFLPSSCF